MIDREAVLETERLLLEPLRAAHAAELYPILRDERLYVWIPLDPPASEAALVRRYEGLERRTSPDGLQVWLNWAIRRKDGRGCIGRAEATVLPEARALLAYEIAHADWGRGYAAETCRRVVTLLVDGYGVMAVEARVDTRNARSIRLLERLDFERIARIENADFFKGAASHEFTYRLSGLPLCRYRRALG